MVSPLNHVEIPVTDLKKAKFFYDKIFGWEIDLNMMANYGLANIKPVSVGFWPIDKIPEKGVNLVFEVDDIESKLDEIVKADGEIVREKYEIAPEIGFAAEFKDIFGNYLGLFSRK